MSQWGAVRTVNGNRYYPEVETKAFVPATEKDIVVGVYLVGVAPGATKLEEELRGLVQQYVGKQYKNWLEMQGT